MTTVRLQATGPQSPQTVWARYVDLSQWSSWSPQIQGVDVPAAESPGHGAGSARLRPGLVGVVLGPLGVRVPFEVLTVDHAARTWSWSARWGPVRVHLHHRVREHPEGVLTDLETSGPWPAVVAYSPLAQWALWRLVR